MIKKNFYALIAIVCFLASFNAYSTEAWGTKAILNPNQNLTIGTKGSAFFEFENTFIETYQAFMNQLHLTIVDVGYFYPQNRVVKKIEELRTQYPLVLEDEDLDFFIEKAFKSPHLDENTKIGVEQALSCCLCELEEKNLVRCVKEYYWAIRKQAKGETKEDVERRVKAVNERRQKYFDDRRKKRAKEKS